MVIQSAKGLNSRSEANPYNEDGFLPLITAPMYSVVDETNYQLFLDNGIQVCLPRNTQLESLEYENDLFFSYSLISFVECYLKKDINAFPKKVCIDTANGNMPALHNAIRKAKDIHGDNITIMAGNVASVDAFIELAKTGCDYIRVGIGGGGGCNTTANTGVGQMNLLHLIQHCYALKSNLYGINNFYQITQNLTEVERCAIKDCKIVADGISSYIKQCENEYGFNDNGYAAINNLLFAGADLVMIGKLFAQCVESAGEKGIRTLYNVKPYNIWNKERLSEKMFGMPELKTPLDYFNLNKNERLLSYSDLVVKYSGMSTREAQKQYQPHLQNVVSTGKKGVKLQDDTWEFEVVKHGDSYQLFKPSEGSVNWIPVRWTLNEWLHGAVNQDVSPYLMGWINSIKSAMAYTNKKTL